MKLAENLEPPIFLQSFPCSMPVHKITVIIIILASNGTERYRVLLIGSQFFRAVTEISSCWEYAIVWGVMVPVHEMVTWYKNTLLNGRRHRGARKTKVKIQGFH